MKTEQQIREALGAMLSGLNRATDLNQRIMGRAAVYCLQWVLEQDELPNVKVLNDTLEKYRNQKQAEEQSSELQRMWQDKLAGRG